MPGGRKMLLIVRAPSKRTPQARKFVFSSYLLNIYVNTTP